MGFPGLTVGPLSIRKVGSAGCGSSPALQGATARKSCAKSSRPINMSEGNTHTDPAEGHLKDQLSLGKEGKGFPLRWKSPLRKGFKDVSGCAKFLSIPRLKRGAQHKSCGEHQILQFEGRSESSALVSTCDKAGSLLPAWLYPQRLLSRSCGVGHCCPDSP